MTSSAGGPDVDEPTAGTSASGGESSALDVIVRESAREPVDPPIRPRGRRPLVVAGVIAVVALAVGVAAAVELWPDSADPPPQLDPSLLTSPVEIRLLTATVDAVGEVSARSGVQVRGPAGDEDAVVTATPIAPGDQVPEGAVVVEVDGRPVIALDGPSPAFRDLRPGDEGDDVAEAQAALVRLELLTGEPNGVFDTATQAAVVALYEGAGYEALGPSEADLAALAAAQASVDEARRLLNDAEIRVSEASDTLPRATILQLDADVAAAQADVAAARADAQAALAAPTAARAEAERVRDELKATVTDLETRLADAQRRLDDGVDADGDPLDADGLEAVADEVADLGAELVAQRERLDVSEVLLVEADADLQEVRRRSDEVIRAAEARLGAARAARSAANASADTTAQRQAVSDAEDVLDRAEADLALLQAALGLRWPRTERLMVDGLPRTLASVAAPGSPADGTIAVLATGTLEVELTVSSADVELIEVGLAAIVTGDGFEADATVVSVAEEAGPDGRHAVLVRSDEAVADAPTDGEVFVEIPVARTRGPVPVVPLAALTRGPGTTTQLTVIDAEGSTRLVRVVTGLDDGTFVTVDAVDDELTTTDRVVVGADNTTTEQADRP